MQYWHMNGAGNDFIVLDARGMTPDFPALARQLCGQFHADGFMAADVSEKADFRLHFYNADGSRGEMCGNGSRCICRFAYEHGMAGEQMTVETDAGIVSGRRMSREQYRVRLNNPGVLDLNRKPGTAYVELGCPGVPHAVTRVPGLCWQQAEALRSRGQALRRDPAFPKGANVNFYDWLGPERVRVLTYERGVEDYTLACGTGSSSVAVTLWIQGELPGGVLTAENRGGILKITVEGQNGQVTGLYLEGPTQVTEIFEI